jgi:site-specific recombinase XerD
MTASNVRNWSPAPAPLARLPFTIDPDTLRHASGFKLANDSRDTRSLQHYLGHKNIAHTVRYTELAPEKGFWRD